MFFVNHQISFQDEARRVDLRHIDICSVDPPGCTDIDDALHCRALDNGNLEVYNHYFFYLYIGVYYYFIFELSVIKAVDFDSRSVST